jgi:flagellar protein FliJ
MPHRPFRLTTLLRLRETLRDQRRVELAESRRADDELRSRLVRLSSQQRRIESQRRAAAGPGELSIEDLLAADRYAAALRAEEVEVREQRQTLAAEIERRRSALLEADRDMKVLEKLRERHQEQQRLDTEQQESKRLDEAALNMARQ